jgi:hypothetical protein
VCGGGGVFVRVSIRAMQPHHAPMRAPMHPLTSYTSTEFALLGDEKNPKVCPTEVRGAQLGDEPRRPCARSRMDQDDTSTPEAHEGKRGVEEREDVCDVDCSWQPRPSSWESMPSGQVGDHGCS